jgi:hypothetical protein
MLKKPSISNREELWGFGAGIPFFVPTRYPILTNDYERQQAIVIDLSDLNSGRGMPKNFTDKRGRVVPSLYRYWTEDEFSEAVNRARDIE